VFFHLIKAKTNFDIFIIVNTSVYYKGIFPSISR